MKTLILSAFLLAVTTPNFANNALRQQNKMPHKIVKSDIGDNDDDKDKNNPPPRP